jgi:hypothetical protein
MEKGMARLTRTAWAGFILGLIVFTIFTAIVGAAWAWTYNRFAHGAVA